MVHDFAVFRGKCRARSLMWKTVRVLTASLLATSVALTLNGSVSTWVLARPPVARSPSTLEASFRFASLPSPNKFLRRTKTCLRTARPSRSKVYF